MGYISAKEAGKKWKISQRRVAVLCSEKRIPGAEMVGNMWIIPENAEKPVDARKTKIEENKDRLAKPFLKWAGGKSQLINEISKYYPFMNGNITKYAEPFVGGGAVLFDILNKFDLQEVYISDINKELINAYKVVKYYPDVLINQLSEIQKSFIPLDTESRKKYYYLKRERYNDIKITGETNIEKATIFIFLNKTCFNGLYRVNKKGEFNVPMGTYKNPLICDEKNLMLVSEKLKNVMIVCADYCKSEKFIDKNTFVYFDPPYRPITSTSNFTSYYNCAFDDNEQKRLAEFVEKMSTRGAKTVVSNSNPKNTDENDDFFDDIYSGLYIVQVYATRMINSNSNARGKISELLIANFN